VTIDHLVYGVPDLTQGIAFVEGKTGVCARFGGQHPGRGTHNALLAVGGIWKLSRLTPSKPGRRVSCSPSFKLLHSLG
jgi:Glyoxalase-like domain